jgi:hypothetical protein
MNVKEKLIEIISSKQWERCDYEQLEYLIQLIDWILTEKLYLGTETIKIIMEEIITTSVHQLNLDLLDTLKDLNEVNKELCSGKI